MRFLFVDRIDEHGESHIRGARSFGPNESLVYESRAGAAPVVAPGAISEAIGQLASWFCIKENDFTSRPIFLFAEAITTLESVSQGEEVNLEAQIHSVDEDTFVFSGQATRNGVAVQSIKNCNGYFMPLADLEDPSVARQRYHALVNGGLLLDDPDPGALDFHGLIDQIIELAPGDQITATKVFSDRAPFFRDHFPRFPVTPIVVLNEMIGAAARKMLVSTPEERLEIKSVEGIKIRSFVKPNEEVQVKVRVEDRQGQLITTSSQLIKNGKPILRGRYVYELKG